MRYVLYIFILICFFSCKKSTTSDTPATDPRLTRLYCNDPEAVNYNWAFPGTPDNTTCFYPTQVFRAAYVYNDSVYFSDGTFLFAKRDTLRIYALDKTKIALVGFCSAYDSIKLTADRFYRAEIDTATDFEIGQPLCRIKDTVSGTIIQSMTDSSLLKVNFSVASDTGTNIHRGTAIKL